MSETKEDIAAERDALRAENDNLRGQLAAAGANRVAVPAHTFQLSQAGLAELETYGVTTVDGQQRTTDEVRGMLTGDQAGLEIAEPTNPAPAPAAVVDRGPAKYGVDYVYPSVEPGKIDPAVAGTPGISGPSADSE